MARAKYTDEMLNFIAKLIKKGSTTKAACMKAADKFNIEYTESMYKSINARLLKSGAKVTKANEPSEQFIKAQNKSYDNTKESFIITWAQNNTQVHKNLFKNILSYKDKKSAELLVIAGKYGSGDESWDKLVRPYLDANRQNIHEFLQVLSDVSINPTASTPLSGMNSITGLESCIIGHPRQHLKSLPVLEGYKHKLLLSTGACTIPNYKRGKAGKKGEFHHMLGFVIVEIDGDNFHVRQVDADDNGNFYDLDIRAKDGEITENTEGIECAVLGDVHVRHNCKTTGAAFEIIDQLKPKSVVVHDVAEMESILHWDREDPFRLMAKEEGLVGDLRDELNGVMEWIEKYKSYNLVIVRSNHDDMLDRWLKSNDWRKNTNRKIFLELANILANSPNAQLKGILPHLIDEKFGGEVKTLSLDDSYRVLNWELGMHGHLGANGSRGGHTQYKNLNTKNIVGHGHHPHREDGHIMTATLSHLRVGFNRGASNWMNGITVIYPDGKAQLIHIIKGKYRP